MRERRAPRIGTTMDLDRHDFELDQLMERIQANDNRLIALQIPEGLKMQALEMMDTIETETSAKVVLAADHPRRRRGVGATQLLCRADGQRSPYFA